MGPVRLSRDRRAACSNRLQALQKDLENRPLGNQRLGARRVEPSIIKHIKKTVWKKQGRQINPASGDRGEGNN